MQFEHILTPDRVLCNAEAGSKKHALEVLSKLLIRGSDVLSTDDVLLALIERERLGCTALAAGVALPHARISSLDAPVGAFVRLTTPVEFDANNDEPVDLICGVVVPESFDNKQAFMQLVETLSKNQTSEKLRACRTSSDLFGALVRLDGIVASVAQQSA